MQSGLQERNLLHDDGSRVQAVHAAEGLSKGLRISRNQSSCQTREQGRLAITRCRQRGTRAVFGSRKPAWTYTWLRSMSTRVLPREKDSLITLSRFSRSDRVSMPSTVRLPTISMPRCPK